MVNIVTIIRTRRAIDSPVQFGRIAFQPEHYRLQSAYAESKIR
jgi:hypothetical protein